MSIEDKAGRTLIRVSTLWEWAFKLMLLSVPTGMTTLMTFIAWLTLKVLEHDKAIAHIEGRLAVAAAVAPAAAVPSTLAVLKEVP